ncbi:hypothetical protein [Bradyrhizobium sp. CCBAU 51745]|uniref:hypothetical protein n=1 Tax=Bradyrhizobium sp. CCBAU 51745 TaxID=1325099 RepID=UPI0023055129|nr:hypothetical protein [Bradyrhizobium sp. CCBAU 51745]
MSIIIGPSMMTGSIISSTSSTSSTRTAGWIDALAVLNIQQLLVIMDSLRSARNLLS